MSYSGDGRVVNPRFREALFGLADSRGSNPHGTSESAEMESRRINANRYETVGKLDQALDRRASLLAQREDQAKNAREHYARSAMGQVPANGQPPQVGGGGTILGTLFLLAVGAAVAYAFLKKDEDVVEGEVLGPMGALGGLALPPPVVVVVPPAPAPTTTTVVTPAPAPLSNPVAVAPPPPVAKRKRRVARARAKPVVITEPTDEPKTNDTVEIKVETA